MTDTLTPTPSLGDDPMALAGAFLSWMNGAALLLGIDAGHRAGAFEALAAAGPVTAEELAAVAGFSPRHLREWLDLMTVGGIVGFDPSDGRYRLPAGATICFTGSSSMNVAPITAAVALSARHVSAVAATLRKGGGIPYDAYRPEFTELMDTMHRRHYDEHLLEGYIEAVPGLQERLEDGISVVDLGCGTGHVLNLLARAFPTSRFVGYDRAEDALDAARAEADALGLTNVRFEAVDVAALPADAAFDLVLAFDAIHDQARPRQVLAEARRVLTDGGRFVLVDIKASSHVHENLQQPNAPWLYGASLFHCMQVSLAEGGEGLGTVWGTQTALELLREAGFADVHLLDTPAADMMNVIYVCR
ncbi:MAG TPA: class I SAM-dependent methyltransferase [Acidimicrobiales bacterium]|nr:class I SAM-dependent methyltransferase [Acidimicrobiales bacterium]